MSSLTAEVAGSMSAAPVAPYFQMPPQNLPEEDDQNLESNWHRDAMILLIELIRALFQGRTDFFVGGNMFIYFDAEQARNRYFRGPDVFLVKDVDGTRQRGTWTVWNECGRYPNLIIELSSPTTAEQDRTTKKDEYEQTFRTPEYFLYDPDSQKLEGWRLGPDFRYQAIVADKDGRMWSEELGAWLGAWRGRFQDGLEAVWLRLFTAKNELVPLFAELEKARADKAEVEVVRLKMLLAEKGLTPPQTAE